MFDLGSVVAHIKADLTDFKAGLSEAKSQADDFGNKTSEVGTNIKDMTEKAALFTEVLAAGVAEVAKEMIGVASQFEQTQTSFGTLLGSEQKAADLMKEIMQFEQHTPFDITTLTNAAKSLLAFGVSSDQVVPKMKELTDMSQGQAFKLQELVSIYGQVNSIQQLNGREVLRLSSIGIPIYQALEDHFKKMGGAAKDAEGNVTSLGTSTVNNAKMSADARKALTDRLAEEQQKLVILEEQHGKTAIAQQKHDLAVQTLKDHIAEATQKLGSHQVALGGVGGAANLTGEQIKKMIEKGQVSAKDFDQVLSEMTSKGGLFFQENIRQMSTFSGIMSSTRSQIEYAILNIMGIDIGAANEVRKGGLFDTLRNGAAMLLEWIQKLQPFLKQLGENKEFQYAIEGFVIALAALAVILPIVVIAMNPIALAIVGIIIVFTYAFVQIRRIIDEWQEIWKLHGKAIQAGVENIIDWFENLWKGIVNTFGRIIEFVKQAFRVLGDFFSGGDPTMAKGDFPAIVNLEKALSKVRDTILYVIDGFKAFGQGVMNVLSIVGNAIKILFEIWIAPFVLIYNWNMFWWNNLIIPLIDLAVAIILRIFYEAQKAIVAVWTAITTWLYNTIFNPLASFISLWATRITTFFTVLWNGIKALFLAVFNYLMNEVVMPKLTAMYDFISGIWNAISGFTAKLWGEISAWIKSHIEAAHTGVTTAGNGISTYLHDLWNGLVSFFRGMYDTIKNAIVAPFQWAKDEIEKIGNAIKAAADKINPYHKSSPSLVENVQNGVADIVTAYKTLSDMTFGSPAFGGITAGDLNMQNSNPITAMHNTIAIDLNGAIIADSQSATSMGEKIGDAIINKLKLNIRF